MQNKVIFKIVTSRIPTRYGEFHLHLFFEPDTGKEHLALTIGNPAEGRAPLVRIHSECFTGDVLGSLRCDCGPQLAASLKMIGDERRGALIYLRQEGRGIGLIEKLKAYNLQDGGLDTVEANISLGHCADCRDYRIGAIILKELGIKEIRLITNNPAKIEGLEDSGITVEERIPIETEITEDNCRYIRTKAERMNHIINMGNF
ncbi:MAG: GTP cyclohydrolase II [Spirochaetia bacterium]|jgi:3,4-dihydroxy 2-butanone 4-phosphate synthase/GTP cyclohydrolase II|nr:GTP cyclohydrolase II [Spirochaetia bacterium]